MKYVTVAWLGIALCFFVTGVLWAVGILLFTDGTRMNTVSAPGCVKCIGVALAMAIIAAASAVVHEVAKWLFR